MQVVPTKMENCSLCFNNSLKNTNFHKIKAHTIEILDVIFGNNNLQLTEDHIICQDCSEKIQAAFSFKCTCISTGDFLTPYEQLRETSPINLRKLSIIKTNIEKLIVIPDGYEVCRLCLEVVDKNFISLSNEPHKCMLRTFIPNLIVENTLNPVICETCFKSLREHTMFINNCLQLQVNQKSMTDEQREIKVETIVGYENSEDLEMTNAAMQAESPCNESPQTIAPNQTTNRTMTLERVDTGLVADESGYEENNTLQVKLENKCKENLEERIICKIDLHLLRNENVSVKKEAEAEVNEVEKRQNTVVSDTLKKPVERSRPRLKIYNCQQCDFQTIFSETLKLHEWKHEAASRVPKYKCRSCSYETRYWNSLKLHKLIYTHCWELHLRKCNLCPYRTNYRTSLEAHKRKHEEFKKTPEDTVSERKSTKVQSCTCQRCNPTTGDENSSKLHNLNYKHLFEMQMKCNLCSYQTKHKPSLELHMSEHKSNLEKQMYKGTLTSNSSEWRPENRREKSSSKIEHRNFPQPHKPDGKQLPEIKAFRCDLCRFEAKRKATIELHMSQHISALRKRTN